MCDHELPHAEQNKIRGRNSGANGGANSLANRSVRGSRQIHWNIDRAKRLGFFCTKFMIVRIVHYMDVGASSYVQNIRGSSTNNFHYRGAHSENLYA